MARNLLPRLRQAPNPANIPPARVADWTELSSPSSLAQLDFGSGDTHIRTRIQSIPSPWARLLLFKHAFEEDGHPARTLVQSELLDALEFLWASRSRAGARPEIVRLQVSDLEVLAARQASQRAERFARALLELMPRRHGGTVEPAFSALTLVLVDGQPVLATSPYTLLFTAEDAARAIGGAFFGYAHGAPYRALSARPFLFQTYVARVLLPQLDDLAATAGDDTDAAAVLRLVKPWLQQEVREARAAAGSRADELAVPVGNNWTEAARLLELTKIDQLSAAVEFFSGAAGAQLATSRWMLRVAREGVRNPPLLLEPSDFDGIYFPGAPRVALPAELVDADRRVLPGHGLEYPWVNPSRDWFADRILPLAQPIERAAVHGFDSFTTSYEGPKRYLLEPQFTLPLTAEVFKYFEPEEIARRTRIEIDRAGRILVELRLPIGPADEGRELKVRRVYDDTSVEDAAGPELAIWPRFRSPSWGNYTLFRRDRSGSVASLVEVVAKKRGDDLPGESERRNDVVQVSTYREAPEVVEFGSTLAGAGRNVRMGVIIPKFEVALAPTDARQQVGVDFGTSNTVASVRSLSGEAREIFGVKELTLPLTTSTEEAQAEADAYFLPHSMRASPFGTAVMHFAQLPHLDIMREPVGVRVNIPFSGVVHSDAKNSVVGDLKWAVDGNGPFLTAGFLRHLLVVIAANAVQAGIKPENIEVAWAYPRSFTPTQLNTMHNLWDQVRIALAKIGVSIGAVKEAIDESKAVLRHFFSAGDLGPAGEASAIIDVGGGTSDIAAYADGKAVLLDSVMLGGRSLTGVRAQGGTAADLANPFVASFVEWSRGRSLNAYPTEEKAVKKYLQDGQDHLAFSYLVQSRWFEAHGRQFATAEAFQRFQALVLYCFGSLFYYVGLALRDQATVPRLVMIAGNGSQFFHWLTDLVPAGDNGAFRAALGQILLRGANAHVDTPVPEVRLTRVPKQEVALGLVAPVRVEALLEATAATGSVVGENVRARLGADAKAVALSATQRFGAADSIEPHQAGALKWDDGEMEIDRFHSALTQQIAGLASYGAQWGQNAVHLERMFSGLRGGRLQDLTRNRLQYLGSVHGPYQGSLFALEAAVVLEQMLGQLLGGSQAAALTPTSSPVRQA